MPTEGEWEVDGIEVIDEFGQLVATAHYGMFDDDGVNRHVIARRIVTAVNCHEELVRLVEEYRENRIEMRSMCGDWPELQQGKYQAEIDRIDAVLAKAREEKR